MVGRQPSESLVLSGDAARERTKRHARLVRFFSMVCTLMVLMACGSTTPLASASVVEKQVGQMRSEGLEFVNFKSSPIQGPRGERIAENYVFDVPNIALDEPAGTIRVFKDPEYAESERRMYALLGVPGPTTKLDYVTVEGTHELILHHQLPRELAQRYIDAFVKTAPAKSSS